MHAKCQLIDATFNSLIWRTEFRQFVSWRQRTVGAQKALITIQKEAALFSFFEARQIGNLKGVTPAVLLAAMPPEAWRRATTIQHYLASELGIVIKVAEKHIASEISSTQRLISGETNLERRALLQQYAGYLQDSNPALSPRTIRIYLSTAKLFLARVGVASIQDLQNAPKLAWVIRQYPASRTSLGPFFTWCKTNHGLAIELPNTSVRTSSISRSNKFISRLELALATLSRNDTTRSQKIGAAVYALCKLHNVKGGVARSIRKTDLKPLGNTGLQLRHSRRWVELNTVLATFLRPELSKLKDTDFVFPGRVRHSPIAATPRFW